MAKRHNATRLLKEGLYLDDIAVRMDVSFQTVVRYMKLQVAEGALKISDVFFALKPGRRATLDALLVGTAGRETREYYSGAAASGISWDEANLFWSLRDSRISRGDMYEHLADLEVGLHRVVRKTLENAFGGDETGWWRKGVPVTVRRSCVQAREDDPDPVADPFAYTTFINLAEILDKHWQLFQPQFSPELTTNRKQLLSRLNRVNQIRNAVMHPVKDRQWDQQDFALVHTLLRGFRLTAEAPATPACGLHQSVRFEHRPRDIRRAARRLIR